MKNFENVLNLLGRIAIAALFLPAGRWQIQAELQGRIVQRHR